MSVPHSIAGLSFGPAAARDFLAIAELDRVAWRDNGNSEFIPDGEHAWRIWADGAIVHVAKENGRVVGAILGFPTRQGTYCVHKVMVDRQLRGRGVGSELFRLLLADIDAHACVACFLTVDPANAVAIRLYERWGFIERRFVAGYYRANEDRLVLTRPPAGGRFCSVADT